MTQWAQNRIKALEKKIFCGFVFKKDSTRCGIKAVRIYNVEGIPPKRGIGFLARMSRERFSLIPVSDESRLHDPKSRKNSMDQIVALKQWRNVLARR